MKTLALLFLSTALSLAAGAPDPKAAGWVALGKADFTNVNCAADTWQWKEDGLLHCTGTPVGVMRTVKEYKNFEMAISWCHLKDAGNSGVFLFAPQDAMDKLVLEWVGVGASRADVYNELRARFANCQQGIADRS